MTGQRVGHLRVGTLEQSTIRQLDGVDIDWVCEHKAAGKDLSRPLLGVTVGQIPNVNLRGESA